MIKIITGNIESFAGVELPNTGWAGHVDLREVITDDIDPNKNEPLVSQHRPDLIADPPVSVRQWSCNATTAGGKIASGFTGRWDARKTKGHRLTVDQQDPGIALANFWKITLGHDLLLTELGERFNNDIAVGIPFLDPKNRGAAHAIQGL